MLKKSILLKNINYFYCKKNLINKKLSLKWFLIKKKDKYFFRRKYTFYKTFLKINLIKSCLKKLKISKLNYNSQLLLSQFCVAEHIRLPSCIFSCFFFNKFLKGTFYSKYKRFGFTLKKNVYVSFYSSNLHAFILKNFNDIFYPFKNQGKFWQSITSKNKFKNQLRKKPDFLIILRDFDFFMYTYFIKSLNYIFDNSIFLYFKLNVFIFFFLNNLKLFFFYSKLIKSLFFFINFKQLRRLGIWSCFSNSYLNKYFLKFFNFNFFYNEKRKKLYKKKINWSLSYCRLSSSFYFKKLLNFFFRYKLRFFKHLMNEIISLQFGFSFFLKKFKKMYKFVLIKTLLTYYFFHNFKKIRGVTNYFKAYKRINYPYFILFYNLFSFWHLNVFISKSTRESSKGVWWFHFCKQVGFFSTFSKFNMKVTNNLRDLNLNYILSKVRKRKIFLKQKKKKLKFYYNRRFIVLKGVHWEQDINLKELFVFKFKRKYYNLLTKIFSVFFFRRTLINLFYLVYTNRLIKNKRLLLKLLPSYQKKKIYKKIKKSSNLTLIKKKKFFFLNKRAKYLSFNFNFLSQYLPSLYEINFKIKCVTMLSSTLLNSSVSSNSVTFKNYLKFSLEGLYKHL